MAYREEYGQADGSASGTAQEGRAPAQPAGQEPSAVPAPAAVEQPAPPAKPKRKLGKRLILFAILAGGLAFGGYEGMEWWNTGRFMISTDDAYVQADITILSAKVSGYVSSVAVSNNQSVKAGDLIAKIDEGDYSLALQSAKDKLATQQSAIERIGKQAEAARAEAAQADAQIAAAEAEAERAEADYARQQQLSRSDYTSRATLETA